MRWPTTDIRGTRATLLRTANALRAPDRWADSTVLGISPMTASVRRRQAARAARIATVAVAHSIIRATSPRIASVLRKPAARAASTDREGRVQRAVRQFAGRPVLLVACYRVGN